MVTEDFVSYETAKLLKEKGFDEYCGYYSSDGEYWGYCTYNHRGKNYISAPTIQMTMKWLRKVHHYYIQVMLDSWVRGGRLGYYVVLQSTDSDFEMMLQDAFNEAYYQTYEEAAETAIKYCLENLI